MKLKMDKLKTLHMQGQYMHTQTTHHAVLKFAAPEV